MNRETDIVAEIRARHVRKSNGKCLNCWCHWPCDAIRAVDALAEVSRNRDTLAACSCTEVCDE